MPKMKTHSGAKKRFRLTGTGKVKHMRAHHVHKFEERAARQSRRLVVDSTLVPGDAKKIKKLLGK